MMIGRTAKRVGKDFRNNGEFFKYNINKEFGAWNMFACYGLVDAYNAVKTTPRKYFFVFLKILLNNKGQL